MSHNHEHSHDHHAHSTHTNRWMGHTQIAIGALFGSFSLLAAGVHNELDGQTHSLRGQAEHTNDRKKRLRLRIGAGALMIAGGIGVFIAERFVPIEKTQLITPMIFGAETGINAHNAYTHSRSGNSSHDTKMGLRHNIADTTQSLVATIASIGSLALGSGSKFAEAFIGYGHVTVMTAIGLASVSGAIKLDRAEQNSVAIDQAHETHDQD